VNPFSLSHYLYDLPNDLIARHPADPRDASRLLVVERKTGRMESMIFHELVDLLQKGDSLVFNDTKVFPSRLIGARSMGGKAEIFLIKQRQGNLWEALVKPGKKLGIGSKVTIGDGFSCEILDVLPNGIRLVHLDFKEGTIDEAIEKFGQIPLPPYMEREAIPELDKINYQTVYAQHTGSVAAPTAGLHFTENMLHRLGDKGVSIDKITLHVGLGTFLPVKAEDIREHKMHQETFEISSQTAEHLNRRPADKLQICVGTTTCRTLESAATESALVQAGKYETNIFIHPGYQFKYVRHLLTNFHQPGSSLLMLVSAFASRELIMEAYAKAIKDRYRFLSYGDAMLIL
jgi:S-adenosylmethionine:tRNA ribosyltransferase-isomerase